MHVVYKYIYLALVVSGLFGAVFVLRVTVMPWCFCVKQKLNTALGINLVRGLLTQNL